MQGMCSACVINQGNQQQKWMLDGFYLSSHRRLFIKFIVVDIVIIIDISFFFQFSFMCSIFFFVCWHLFCLGTQAFVHELSFILNWILNFVVIMYDAMPCGGSWFFQLASWEVYFYFCYIPCYLLLLPFIIILIFIVVIFHCF
jgi:hypothetical protein